MKGKREFRVPLSPACIELLRKLPRQGAEGLVFVARQSRRALNKMELPRVMDRLGQKGVTTVHGFRSSFRDWAGETTAFAHDICEAALAHSRGDATVQAYARGDLFDKRRKLMEAWAKYCTSPPTKIGKAAGDVMALRGGR
jgi:integrase